MNHKRVERLMKRHRMAGFVPRKRLVTTTPSAHRIPDLLAGDFGASKPGLATSSATRRFLTVRWWEATASCPSQRAREAEGSLSLWNGGEGGKQP